MKKTAALIFAFAISAFAFDINTATKAEWLQIKGIGEKKAERILTYRKEHGKFNSVEELKNVKGIGNKIIEIIKQQNDS